GFLLTFVSFVSAETVPTPAKSKPVGPYQPAIEHIAKLPAPPDGFKWAVNPDFTDEFNGTTLNPSKWFDKSPHWTNGRPPATFKADTVSVKDGNLRIRNRRLNPTEGSDGKPGDTYSHAGGAVASKSEKAHYGYYETRMKASLSPLSSTFWLKNRPEEISYINESGKLIRENHRQELDIIETVGTPTKLKNWNEYFNANTHYEVSVKGGEKMPTASVGSPQGDAKKIAPTTDDYNTYGCWWVDAKTLHFYYNGKFLFTINPSTKYNTQPFARSMYMHLVTETYDWEPTLPSDEDLTDPNKSTTLYDWVRSYVLVHN
ncbi:MAG: family 16 glycosylhydrolase, partial [Luteolibacter sp.]